jgi:hypothetical protein
MYGKDHREEKHLHAGGREAVHMAVVATWRELIFFPGVNCSGFLKPEKYFFRTSQLRCVCAYLIPECRLNAFVSLSPCVFTMPLFSSAPSIHAVVRKLCLVSPDNVHFA